MNPTCRNCGSTDTYWRQRLMHPHGYVWFVRCAACGCEVPA